MVNVNSWAKRFNKNNSMYMIQSKKLYSTRQTSFDRSKRPKPHSNILSDDVTHFTFEKTPRF